jgi:hypothetical protein
VRIGQGGQGRQEAVAFRLGVNMRFHMSEIPYACQKINWPFHGGLNVLWVANGHQDLQTARAGVTPWSAMAGFLVR